MLLMQDASQVIGDRLHHSAQTSGDSIVHHQDDAAIAAEDNDALGEDE